MYKLSKSIIPKNKFYQYLLLIVQTPYAGGYRQNQYILKRIIPKTYFTKANNYGKEATYVLK